MSVIRLIDKTGSAKSWGPQDVVDALQKDIDEGKVGNKLIVVHLDSSNEQFKTTFLQCGMTASEIVGLLEITKMDVYRKLIAK
jgi:hypothetical protein